MEPNEFARKLHALLTEVGVPSEINGTRVELVDQEKRKISLCLDPPYKPGWMTFNGQLRIILWYFRSISNVEESIMVPRKAEQSPTDQ